MANQKSGPVWVTYLGRTEYENLNSYWAFCESESDPPARVALLHAASAASEADRLADRFSALSRVYLKDPPGIEPIPFDGEDVDSFQKASLAVFETAADELTADLIVDVSPTSWSHVPILLMKSVWAFRHRVRRVVYFQYAEPGLREMPYPLIPRQSIFRHDLLTVFPEPQEKKA
jgi:hypothetical protein